MGKKYSKLKPEEVEDLKQITHCKSLSAAIACREILSLAYFSAIPSKTSAHAVTPKELNRWYRGFLRDCPSGTLSKEVGTAVSVFGNIHYRLSVSLPWQSRTPLVTLQRVVHADNAQ